MSYTVSFDEKVKGWNQFHDWLPEGMIGMNNNFFSFKNGQLYQHYDPNAVRNNFFGEQFTSRIKTVFNISPEDDKIFKNLILESSVPLDVSVKTNYATGMIKASEFIQKGSRYFAYLRKNEDDAQSFGRKQGIGEIEIVASNVITFSTIPNNVNIGDTLFQKNGGVSEIIGVVQSKTSTTITVASVDNTPVVSNFAFVRKPNRIEGGEIRGYYMEVELEYDGTEPIEVFAIETNIKKSFV